MGGSSAIGAAVAAELVTLGHDLVLWGRDPVRLAAAATGCAREERSVRTVGVDLLDRDAVDAAVSELADEPLAAMVWAAGLFDWASTEQADPATWRRVLEVNLVAAAVVTAGLAPALIAAGPGSSLVYLGSGAARGAFANNAAYVASKHGLAGLADAVHLDLRERGVNVSLVSPGLVAAGSGLASPLGQTHPDSLLTAAEVAHAVRFVVTFPGTGCPHEVVLEPRRSS